MILLEKIVESFNLLCFKTNFFQKLTRAHSTSSRNQISFSISA